MPRRITITRTDKPRWFMYRGEFVSKYKVKLIARIVVGPYLCKVYQFHHDRTAFWQCGNSYANQPTIEAAIEHAKAVLSSTDYPCWPYKPWMK